MATINVIFNLSRSSIPQSLASHSVRPSLKTSRVCFTSASELGMAKGRNGVEKSRNASSRRAYDDKDWSTKAKQTMEEDVENGKKLLDGLKGAATEYAQETMENVKDAKEIITETAKEYADGATATEKTNEAAETISDKAEEGTDKVAETAGDGGD